MRKLWIDSLLGTVFIFFLIWLIYSVSALRIFNLFDPIGEALSDMEFTDVVFSRLRETPKADTNVVLVNIGNLSRGELAIELNEISKHKPKVIGIDSFFSRPKEDTLGDMMLSEAIRNAGNVVMVSQLVKLNQETGNFDSVRYSHPMFSGVAADNSYANLATDNEAVTQEDFKVTRKFAPSRYISGDINNQELAFSVKLAQLYDSVKTEEFLSRNQAIEAINYRGDIKATGYDNRIKQQFTALDVADIFTGNYVPSVFKDKIVLMGFLGRDFYDTSWEDKFFTPMNAKYAGKANPDMYGVVIHANIIAMILNRDYVRTFPIWMDAAIGIIIVFFNIMFFTVIYRKLSKWYDGVTKLFQLIELMILLVLIIMFFHWFSLKLTLTFAFYGIALAGDGLEVFYSVVMNLFSRMGRTQVFSLEDQ
ncbi:MAG TPA: CHASE2 domain-containing protein [Cyclobacteriaceae bacterium]|nr:CHASE2 domain-containing protein [Cyclobacteriaceae bacterium]